MDEPTHRLTSRGLQLRDLLTFEQWVDVGQRIARFSSACAWSIGDWINYGQAAFGTRYRAALDLTALDFQTLRNYAWVARRVPMSRRRDRLSFQHHAEVAALPEASQELWLGRAESDRWSRNELRRHLREHHRSPEEREIAPAMVLKISVGPERERRWREAAAVQDVELAEWVAAAADAATDAVLNST